MPKHISTCGRLAILLAAITVLAISGRVEAQAPRAKADKKRGDRVAAVPEKVGAKTIEPEKTQPGDAKTPAVDSRYKWFPVDKRAELDGKYVARWIREPPVTADSIARFENYYKKYALRRLVDPKYLPQISVVRRDFRRHLRDAKDKRDTDKDSFNLMNKIALDFLPYIIRDPEIHPAARYNATLILGDLNLRKASKRGNDAIPLPDALPKLVENILMNRNQIDAVRVAAMIGISRHAMSMREHESPVLLPLKAMTTGAMLKIVAAKKPARGRTPDAHHWMRRQAIEILGELGYAGAGGRVALALVDSAADKDAPVWLRCSAARALGRLNLSPADAASVDPKTVASTLRELVADICRAEVARARGEKGSVSQAQLLADLTCVQEGLTGLTALGAEHKQKAAIAALDGRFKVVYTTVAEDVGAAIMPEAIEMKVSDFLGVKSPAVPPVDGPMPPMVKPEEPGKPIPKDPPKNVAPGELDFG